MSQSVTGVGTIHEVASSTVYRNTDGSGAETTSFAYDNWINAPDHGDNHAAVNDNAERTLHQ